MYDQTDLLFVNGQNHANRIRYSVLNSFDNAQLATWICKVLQ